MLLTELPAIGIPIYCVHYCDENLTSGSTGRSESATSATRIAQVATAASTTFLRWASSPGHRPPLGRIRLAAVGRMTSGRCVYSVWTLRVSDFKSVTGTLTLSLVIRRVFSLPSRPPPSVIGNPSPASPIRYDFLSQLLAKGDYVANDRQSEHVLDSRSHGPRTLKHAFDVENDGWQSNIDASSELWPRNRPDRPNRQDWAVCEKERYQKGCRAESHAVTVPTSPELGSSPTRKFGPVMASLGRTVLTRAVKRGKLRPHL